MRALLCILASATKSVTHKAIAGERLDLSGAPAVPIECALDFAPQAGKRQGR